MSAFNTLPNTINISGADYPINTDFRTVILFLEMWEDEELPPEYKIAIMADMFGIDNPDGISQVWKWINENEEQKNSDSTVKVIDFTIDEKLIYSAFMLDYGIDLYDIDYLHWYKFKALLQGLSDRTMMREVMKIRATDTSKIKDTEQRENMRKLQRLYELPDREAEKLLEEINAKGW